MGNKSTSLFPNPATDAALIAFAQANPQATIADFVLALFQCGQIIVADSPTPKFILANGNGVQAIVNQFYPNSFANTAKQSFNAISDYVRLDIFPDPTLFDLATKVYTASRTTVSSIKKMQDDAAIAYWNSHQDNPALLWEAFGKGRGGPITSQEGATLGVSAPAYLDALSRGIDGVGLSNDPQSYANFVMHVDAANSNHVLDDSGRIVHAPTAHIALDNPKIGTDNVAHRAMVRARSQASEQAARDNINSKKMYQVPPSAENPQGILNPNYTGDGNPANFGYQPGVTFDGGTLQVVDATTGLVMNPILPPDNNSVPSGGIVTPNPGGNDPSTLYHPPTGYQPPKSKFWIWIAGAAAAIALMK